MFGAGKIDQTLGNAQLVFGRLGHTDFIDGQGDDGSAEFARQNHTVFGVALTIFEIDGVDDGFAAMQLERGSMTGVSVESITSGAFTDEVKRVTTSFISAISLRPTKAVQRSSAFEPSAACSRPTATQPSQSPASCNSRHFFDPLALQRSPIEKYEFS